MMFKPWLILLEVTNRCNARCAYCNHKYITQLCDMDFDLYKRIVDETRSYGRVLHPNGYGEPLLYPHIIEAIEYANKKGFKTVMYTNASLLDEDMARQILDAKLNEMRLSVDGYDRESFESLRSGLSWDTVVNNVKNFHDIKNRGGYKTLTMARPTVTGEYVSKRNLMINFWKPYVDIVHPVRECYWASSPEIEQRRWSSGEGFRCKRVYTHLAVKSNGNLTICSCDRGDYAMSNLKQRKNILKTFNGERFNNIRKAIETGVNYPTLCHTCPEAGMTARIRGQQVLSNRLF